ncbi:MAG: AAA domain-containing protein [Sphaerochaeta sp.]|nr:AAA domain-containing protein [Sphaerochaeta sp.]
METLEVLPLNEEQRDAIQHGLCDPLTIITGPPGTGKPQVVTQLLVNAVFQEEKVLFSSRNNKAVDVVENRINALGPRPIMLRMGGAFNASHIIPLVEQVLSRLVIEAERMEAERYEQEYRQELAKLKALEAERSHVVDLRNKVDALEQNLCDSREKWASVFDRYDRKQWSRWSAEYGACKQARADALRWVKTIRGRLFPGRFVQPLQQKYQRLRTELNDHFCSWNLKDFIPLPENWRDEAAFFAATNTWGAWLDLLEKVGDYQASLSTLEKARTIEGLEAAWDKQASVVRWAASRFWAQWVLVQPNMLTEEQRMQMVEVLTLLRIAANTNGPVAPSLSQKISHLQRNLTLFLPCWSVTSLSAKGRIPLVPGFFDLVVIDEASQCDIASALPLLYRAKRAVIIGGPKQLEYITTIPGQLDYSLLERYGIPSEWSYTSNSLYGLAAASVTPEQIIGLKEHHRSTSSIIEFSNQEFYDGQLRIATVVASLNPPRNTRPGIYWKNIKGLTVRPSAQGGLVNRPEANAVVTSLRKLVASGYRGSLGVVTPFRAQADVINALVAKDETLHGYLDSNNACTINTIHAFQGDERDMILFSPVVAPGVTESALTFLQKTGNLFNVAVTRARAVLLVIGDLAFCGNCGVPYLEHYVTYAQSLEREQPFEHSYPASRKYSQVNNPDQVSPWGKVLYQALYDGRILPAVQYPVEQYRLDFAILVGDRKLDIEVDGLMCHRVWGGRYCLSDQIRNRRLRDLGWDVLRFWVYQVRDQTSWCVEQVKAWKEAIH